MFACLSDISRGRADSLGLEILSQLFGWLGNRCGVMEALSELCPVLKANYISSL